MMQVSSKRTNVPGMSTTNRGTRGGYRGRGRGARGYYGGGGGGGYNQYQTPYSSGPGAYPRRGRGAWR